MTTTPVPAQPIPSSGMPAPLAVAGASVRFGAAEILREVSVEFPRGLVTAIIGPNGAGKSTLLSVAAGDCRPQSGSALLGGEPVHGLGARQLARRRAVMPQSSTVAFPFTVREVVAMGRIAWGSTPAADGEIVASALDLAEITSFAERTITTLSGGERQRVAFARVIAQAMPVGEGSVILLDEPTAAMDIAHAEATLRAIRELAARGVAIGIVLHDLDAAAAYADRVVLMDRGQVVAAGEVATVCAAETLSRVYGTPIETFTHGGRLRISPARPV